MKIKINSICVFILLFSCFQDLALGSENSPEEETALPASSLTNSVAPITIEPGTIITNLQGDTSSFQRFSITVPPEQRLLKIETGGGTGDADLYLRQIYEPTLENYDYRPYVFGNSEAIAIEDPVPDVWHILLHGYKEYTNVWIKVTCVPEEASLSRKDEALGKNMELALYYELSGFAGHEKDWNTELRAQALSEEGWVAFNAGDSVAAIKAWTKWHEVEPDNADPLSLVGDVYLYSSQIEQAMSYYRQSLEIYPGQIGLAVRYARLLDTLADQPAEAKKVLNFYAKLFPNNSIVTLAQAAWLARRHRYDDARILTQHVVETTPAESVAERLQALAMLHDLLPSVAERVKNVNSILDIAKQPGMGPALLWSIRDYDLLKYPESWMMLNFISTLTEQNISPEMRRHYLNLLPRREISVEDFRHGKMSKDWTTSQDENLLKSGQLVLSADLTKTEVALRLTQSEAMPNGFIDVSIENSSGFFWIYARRSASSMARFGFDEDGRVYLQLWLNGQLLVNHNRLWSKQIDKARLRLELRGDGAYGYIDDTLVFNAPLAIPHDMGLGWWGFAPWSQHPGVAKVTVQRLTGGPLPVLIGLLPDSSTLTATWMENEEAENINLLQSRMRELSALTPAWYQQHKNGKISKTDARPNMDLRLLSRYYRVRLLPSIRVADPYLLDLDSVINTAYSDHVDGFVLMVKKMPDPDWIAIAETALLNSNLTLLLLLLDPNLSSAQTREICSQVGLFPAPRQMMTLPVIESQHLPQTPKNAPVNETAPNAVLLL